MTALPADLPYVVDLEVDVSHVTPFADATTAATVYVPKDLRDDACAVFCFAGGSYRKEYYDPDLGDDTSYSMARHLAGAGHVVVTCDHLGMGASSSPRPAVDLTWEVMAASADATVREVTRRLGHGQVAEQSAPFVPRRVIGAGHSMGGCILTVAQARHQTFDAVAMLGWSGLGTVLPVDPRASGNPPARTGFRPDRVLRPDGYYDLVKDARMDYVYHRPDVPARAVDAARLLDSRQPPCVADHRGGMLAPGAVHAEAAAIRVPVLVAAGQYDVVQNLRAEAGAYPAATDITLVEVVDAAHLFNFAGRRGAFFDRLARWIGTLGPFVRT